MKKTKILSLIILVVLLTSGCSTLFGGSSIEHLTVEADQPLRISVIGTNGQKITKTTPFTTEIQRKYDYTLKIRSDVYESENIFLNKKIRTLSVFNLLCLVCWAVDFVTGKVWEHEQLYVEFDTRDLERKKAMGLDSFKSDVYVTITGLDENKEPAKIQAHKTIKFTKVI